MDLSGHEEEIPIPISSSTYVGQSHGHGHGHSLLHDHPTPPPLSLHHHHHHHPHPHPNPPSTNGPPPPPLPLPLSNPIINEEQQQQQHSKKGGAVVKYRECLKNHAASIGGNATDGCGEFMPSGEEGTLEALKCSACNCHRNFHRKEVEGECDYFNNNHHHHIKLLGGGRKLMGGHKGVLISSSSPDAAAAFGYNSNSNNNNNSLIPRPTPHNMIMPLGAMQTSESDEMEGTAGYPRPPMMKKRFRTKFSAEQKEKMLAFAEKAGWRLQKQEESVVQHFCQEIGVKRRVLKVWMHNNKHNFAKKNPLLPSTLNDNRINEMN